MLKFPRWPQNHPEAKRLQRQRQTRRIAKGTDEIVYLSVIVAGALLLLMTVCIIMFIIANSIYAEILI